MESIIAFTKVALPFGWLGNMAPYPVTYGGEAWRTTEALFQALRFEDESIREAIRQEKSPMAVKFIAQRHKSKMVVVPRARPTSTTCGGSCGSNSRPIRP